MSNVKDKKTSCVAMMVTGSQPYIPLINAILSLHQCEISPDGFGFFNDFYDDGIIFLIPAVLVSYYVLSYLTLFKKNASEVI